APLRERGDDIRILATHFLAQMARELSEPVKSISGDAMHALCAYSFPGNVRELRNLIERLCIMVPGEVIQASDLPANVSDMAYRHAAADKGLAGQSPASLKEAKSDFERAFILDKLEENQWNVSKTAEAIGIER